MDGNALNGLYGEDGHTEVAEHPQVALGNGRSGFDEVVI